MPSGLEFTSVLLLAFVMMIVLAYVPHKLIQRGVIPGHRMASLFLETAVERRQWALQMLTAWKAVAARHGNTALPVGDVAGIPERIGWRSA